MHEIKYQQAGQRQHCRLYIDSTCRAELIIEPTAVGYNLSLPRGESEFKTWLRHNAKWLLPQTRPPYRDAASVVTAAKLLLNEFSNYCRVNAPDTTAQQQNARRLTEYLAANS